MAKAKAAKKKTAKTKPAKEKKKLAEVVDDLPFEDKASENGNGQQHEPAKEEVEEVVEKKEKPKPKKGTITIKSVKIKGMKAEMSFTKIEKDGSETHDPTRKSSRFIHKDFGKAMNDLRIHLAILCNCIPLRQVKQIEDFNEDALADYHVTGVSRGGKVDQEIIVITGYRDTFRDKTVTLNTPFELVEEIKDTRYTYMEDMNKKVDAVMSEARQYMDGTKVGEDPQGSFDFPENEEEEGEVVEQQ